MQIFPPGNFFQAEIFSKKSKWVYKKIPPENIIQLEYTNHWVTHPTTNHDLVA